jgi:predicted nucleic acid-binding protein
MDTSFLVAVEVASHAEHSRARGRIDKLLKAGDTLSLTPQILAEFIHVVTDSRRFSSPLSVEEAVHRAANWWDAAEIVHVFPTGDSTLLFLTWMEQHSLGRKRLLDTMLAATLYSRGITSLLTLDPGDFRIFGKFVFPASS